MKDFPVFTTEFGVASLILREVPYQGTAYIRIQSSLDPENLVKECVSFCRMVGAERIYAKGHEALAQYPLHCVVNKMSMALEHREPEANLWPVTEETVAQWREIYNKGMRPFDNHATMTSRDEKKILESGGAYFVHRDRELLGIGWMEGNELLALVSTVPGMGETVARTLFTTVNEDRIVLTVVSTNQRAIRLYERMGFVKIGEVSRWHEVFPGKRS